MTETATHDDLHPDFDLFKDRLQMARTRFAVQAWRSPEPKRRDELSSLSRRIRLVIDQYEQRRSIGVRSIDAAHYLDKLRCKIAAASTCERGRIHLAFASDAEELSNEGALVLGLVTSELVVRALERAAANRSRAVTVRFEHGPSGHYLTVAEVRPRRRMSILGGCGSVGIDLVRHLVRDLGGAVVTADDGAAVKVRLTLGEGDLASPLRNISPRRSPNPRRAHVFAGKEDLHEFRHS